MSDIKRRKDQHLDIVLTGDVGPSNDVSPFSAFTFVHEAMPDLSLNEIDISAEFLSKPLRAPLLISSMTGGPTRAEAINTALATAAEAIGVAFAVGSQRIAIEASGDAGLGKRLRQLAPTIPLLANVGAAQIAEWPDPTIALRAVDMIEADALIVHFNPLQEAVQHGGDTDWRNIKSRLAAVAKASPVPLVAKEVGCGISGETARTLLDLGIGVIDVAGHGGTSWAAVEARRSQDLQHAQIAEAFRDWGITTPESILAVRAACPDVPIIASGGIRDGIDAAKAIRLGANIVGQAAHLLEAALNGPEAVARALGATIAQIRIACFCTGSRSLADLRRAPLSANLGEHTRL
ncbi:MAG: type 2 isopentenyl-diphosphate Delta-isomerase [Pseudomonadota bacterium]